MLTLACLTAIVPWAYRDPINAPLRRGYEWLGLARWMMRLKDDQRAMKLLERAIEFGLDESHLFRAIWDLSLLRNRLGDYEAAIHLWMQLAESNNNYRLNALEELAKYYEHRRRDYRTALLYAQKAVELQPSEGLQRRVARIQHKLSTPFTSPLL